VISPTQRPLPDNTQLSQETDLHAAGEIRNPRIPANEWQQTHSLDRAATRLGLLQLLVSKMPLYFYSKCPYISTQNAPIFLFKTTSQELYICISVHLNSRLKKSNKMQQYADIYLLLNLCTCCGRPSRLSSGLFGHVSRSVLSR